MKAEEWLWVRVLKLANLLLTVNVREDMRHSRDHKEDNIR